MARRVNMHLDDDFADCIELHKPKSLALAAFCALLIEEALDKRGEAQTMGEPAARRASSNTLTSSNKKNIKPKNIYAHCAELEPHEGLIREFWQIKKGSKGETAWKLLTGELLKIQQKYGDAVVREQLQLAINGKWQGIQLKNYEQFSAPKGNAPAQPEFKHPASRVFSGGKFVDEESTDGGVLKDLF